MYFIDTHTHLYLDDFAGDIDQLITEAGDVSVKRFFLPNIDSTSIDAMHSLEQKYPGTCFAMMGLHPCSVKDNWKSEMNSMEEWFQKRTYVAIGEMGIDLYWDRTYFAEQQEVFRRQIAMANDLGLPVVIHSRDSFREIMDLLKTNKKESPCGIFHCFSGTVEEAKEVIDLGFYVGIGGVLTYKKSGLDETLKSVSLDHIVLETDAPYLTPVPHRGKRNIPAYLRIIGEKVADIKGVSPEDVAKKTSANAEQLFGVPALKQ